MDQDSSDVMTLGVSDGLPPSQISARRRKSSAIPDLDSTEKGIQYRGGERRRVARNVQRRRSTLEDHQKVNARNVAMWPWRWAIGRQGQEAGCLVTGQWA
mmetsp:Transcript_31121/g.74201  ORF Transcript_31121/g.74201 Transcript_31121/m.74201 type:complete len:100 (+) Transcript_31121:195-494(+)